MNLTTLEILEIEDAVANHVVSMAFLWNRHVRGKDCINRCFVREIYSHARPLIHVLEKYRTQKDECSKGESMIISPTGKGIREMDQWGSGLYGASRGHGKTHNGLDFICEPGQSIFSPIEGTITRIARPYAKGAFLGVEIKGKVLTIVLFYILPNQELIGRSVGQGDIIGSAQDISEKHPGITPHVHLRVSSIDPLVLMKGGEV